jgi:hypothetical protein
MPFKMFGIPSANLFVGCSGLPLLHSQLRQLALLFDLFAQINLGRFALAVAKLPLDVIAGRASELRLGCRTRPAVAVLDVRRDAGLDREPFPVVPERRLRPCLSLNQ